MATHHCPHCQKTFLRKKFLEDHLARKTPCQAREAVIPEPEYDCDKCPKVFKHHSSACRHRAQCTGPKKSLAQKLVEAQRTINELSRQIDRGTSSPNVTQIVNNNNSVTNNITNVINVTVKNYGAEQQEYLENLTYPQLKKILKLSPDNETILSMIRFIHKNKDHPENNNVKLDSRDSDVISVYKNSSWNEEKTDRTIYDIICRSRVRFIDVEPQLSTGMTKRKLEALNDYLEKVEDMSNSEDATMYSDEFAFMDLISKVKDVLL